MISKIVILILMLFIAEVGLAQHRISGFVKDKTTGETLIGASVIEPTNKRGTTTDRTGFFTLSVASDSVLISFIGYKPQSIHTRFANDSILQIKLEENTEQIETVQVIGQRKKQFNISTLSSAEMNSIPSLGAKPDVIKTLQLMPGIQPAQEGSSHLVVRGGSPGENLYLFDGVPVIYVSHLGGFMSVFNPDMINDMTVYKGGFPAQYGGKLSSIVNITQREGDQSQKKGSLSVGVTDASFVAEGPLKSKKGAYIVTGRKTMYDPLLWGASALSGGGDYFLLSGFYDLNAKVSYRPDAKNSYHFNLYQGDDYLRYWTKPTGNRNEKSKQLHIWGNWLAALRWNRVVSSSLTSENIFSYTRYRLKFSRDYKTGTKDNRERYLRENLSAVSDISLRSNWNWQASNNWKLNFGVNTSLLFFVPNRVVNTTATHTFVDEDEWANETALYFSNEISLADWLDVEAGARAVYYTAYDFSNFKLEPRVALNINLAGNQVINFSYQDVGQNSHLLLSSGSIMNNEMWVPSGKGIEPANSVQYSVGWKSSWFKGQLQSEINVYQKDLSNLSTYKDGYSSLLGDGGWRSKIISGGKGESKGFELMLRKPVGKWTGFAAYTFSETTRLYNDLNKGKGKVFPYEFDRPNALAVSLGRKLNDRVSVNATWVYQTGMPYTPALGQQLTHDGEIAFAFGDRNSKRMDDYHRLDLGMKYQKTSKHGRRAEWTFSVYNAYSRRNAYYYYYDTQRRDIYEASTSTNIKLFKAVMFPIIPSASYKVYFDGNRYDKTNTGSRREKKTLKERMHKFLYFD